MQCFRGSLLESGEAIVVAIHGVELNLTPAGNPKSALIDINHLTNRASYPFSYLFPHCRLHPPGELSLINFEVKQLLELLEQALSQQEDFEPD